MSEATTKISITLKSGLKLGLARNFDKAPIIQVIRTPRTEQVIATSGVKMRVSQVTYY